jgi:hypothetical protein
VVAEGIDCNPAYLRILTGSIVQRNHPLNFVTQGLIDCSLTGDRSASGSFGSPSGFEDFAAAL